MHRRIFFYASAMLPAMLPGCITEYPSTLLRHLDCVLLWRYMHRESLSTFTTPMSFLKWVPNINDIVESSPKLPEVFPNIFAPPWDAPCWSLEFLADATCSNGTEHYCKWLNNTQFERHTLHLFITWKDISYIESFEKVYFTPVISLPCII